MSSPRELVRRSSNQGDASRATKNDLAINANTWSDLSARSIAGLSARVALIVVVALLLFYIFHFAQPDFSSDDAVLSMLAESMWEQGSIFPNGWVSNNGDLMVPSGALLVAPLLAWFPNSFALHGVASVFAILLMIFAFVWFLRSARLAPAAIALAAAVVASGLSWISAIFIYLQTTYVWWPAAFFLGAAVITQLRQSEERMKLDRAARGLLLAAVVFAVCVANPARALIMVVFPLYVFDRVLVGTTPGRRAVRSRTVAIIDTLGFRDRLLLAWGAAFVAATIFYLLLTHFGLVKTVHNVSSLQWKGVQGVRAHTQIFLDGWIPYLGALRETNAPAGITESILQPLRLAFAVWLSWVGIAEVARLRRSGDPLRGALAAALLAAFLPILALYLLMAPMAVNVTTIRYFTVPILILVALAAFRISAAKGWRRRLVPGAMVFASVAVVLIAAARFVPAAANLSAPILQMRTTSIMRLVDLLDREDLSWGYATWWNAGVTTVLSGGRSRVSPVELTPSGISPYPVMVQQDWYRPARRSGRTFLALARSEASAEGLTNLRATVGTPSRVIDSAEHVVLVYEHNIISDFTCGARTPVDEPLDVTQGASARIVSAEMIIGTAQAPHRARVKIRNDGRTPLDGIGAFPITVGMRLRDGAGALIDADWVHWPLPCPVGAGEERSFVVPMPERSPVASAIEVDLVQEGVNWFHQWGAEIAIMEILP